MKSKATRKALLFALLATLSLPVFAAAKITFKTARKAGSTVKLYVISNGEVKADGIKGGQIRTGGNYIYTLTGQTVTLEGDITELHCQDNQITSFEFEACDNLKELWCHNNQLTTLDLTNCKGLTHLWCFKNKLTSLNLTKCVELTKLWSQENELTTLDVTTCPKLRDMWAFKNQLTSVNVAGCNDLQSLLVHKNELTTVDISQCAALERLDCQYNKITSLNLQNSEKLEMLYCYGNQLTSLDLSHCPNLKALECNSNWLASIDVSKCPILNWISCEQNLLTCSAMESIVNQIPNRKEERVNGTLVVITEKEMKADPIVGNIMTENEVAAALAKAWKVYYIPKDDTTKLKDYPGRPGTCADYDHETFKVTVAKTTNGSISIKGAEDLNAVPFGTELTVEVAPEEGYSLQRLMANEKDITNTKKFFVSRNVTVTALFVSPLREITEAKLKVYPNPAATEVNIQGAPALSEVKLYSMDGVRLLSIMTDASGAAVLDVSDVPEGTYLVVLQDGVYKLNTRRLSVKR